jgi:hypothetical protein
MLDAVLLEEQGDPALQPIVGRFAARPVLE